MGSSSNSIWKANSRENCQDIRTVKTGRGWNSKLKVKCSGRTEEEKKVGRKIVKAVGTDKSKGKSKAETKPFHYLNHWLSF